MTARASIIPVGSWPREAAAFPKGRSVVYFVRIGRHIKIGFSTNLAARLDSFSTSAVDMELLIAIPGDRTLEKELHGLFVEARIAREMFRSHWRITHFVDDVEIHGLAFGMERLEATSPKRRREQQTAEHKDRLRAVRRRKAELDAYYASLVAQRKQEIGR